MSLETWKVEFYSETAYDVAKGDNDIRCIEHSLKKWEGLSKQNCEKHRVDLDRDWLQEYDATAHFALNADSCSLCRLDENRWSGGDSECDHCPIAKAFEQTCRDEWAAFIADGSVAPMQKLLHKTLEFYKGQNQ